MANTIKVKRSNVPGKVPAISDLDFGELGINTADGKIFIKKMGTGPQERYHTLIEFLGDNNHHVWYDIKDDTGAAAPLTPGQRYTIEAEVAPGPGGFSGGFEISYYDGSTQIAGDSFPQVYDGWQKLAYSFVVPAGTAGATTPRIRLIGWGEGNAGESLKLGEVRAFEDYSLVPRQVNPLTEWRDVSYGSVLDYGHPGPDGDINATRQTLTGPDGHHLYFDLAAPLVVGETYMFSAEVKPDDTTGFTGEFQIAYYSSGDAVNDKLVMLNPGWQTVQFEFVAGEDINNYPRVRLVGSDRGLDGEILYFGRIELYNTSGPATGETVVGNNYFTADSNWDSSDDGTNLTYDQGSMTPGETSEDTIVEFTGVAVS